MMNRFGKNTLDKRQNLSKRKILFSIIFFPEMEAKIVFIVSGKFRGGWADSSEKLEGGRMAPLAHLRIEKNKTDGNRYIYLFHRVFDLAPGQKTPVCRDRERVSTQEPSFL